MLINCTQHSSISSAAMIINCTQHNSTGTHQALNLTAQTARVYESEQVFERQTLGLRLLFER